MTVEVESIVLPDRRTAVALARQFVADRIHGVQGGEATLVTTELVNDALAVTEHELQLTLRSSPHAVTIEVRHIITGGPSALGSRPSPRSLRIIEIMCENWGHHHDGDGETVWATIALSPVS
jgi:hypothetical protein